VQYAEAVGKYPKLDGVRVAFPHRTVFDRYQYTRAAADCKQRSKSLTGAIEESLD
jgi:hypothetical protein